MKVIIAGVTAFLLLLYTMYYRKQKAREYEIELEEMRKPQINVIPDSVANDLVGRLETISRAFETKIEPDKRKYRLLIDSGERNTTTYPLPTEYQLQLPETIYGMEKISLEKAVFPMSLELINQHSQTLNMTITWSIAGPMSYDMTLDAGNYTITSLAAMIQTKMDFAATQLSALGGTWEVSIDPNTLLLSIKVLTFPGGVAQTVSITLFSTNNYILSILGLTNEVGGNAGISQTVALTGTDPVNVAYPQNLLIYLDNKSMNFNSLRIMKSSEIDSRCFANFTMPSGNGIYGCGGVPSTGTVSGASILVQGTSGASGLGTYTVTKDMTNAYYKAYEGAIPTIRYINVKIKQLLPNGSVVTPDFNNSNHSMEFEMKARVDKTTLTTEGRVPLS
jgi:hypothetical protein